MLPDNCWFSLLAQSVIIFFFAIDISITSNAADLPKEFVYLAQIDPSIVQDMRYAGYNNFIGKPIAGYLAPHCIMTKETAISLSKVQQKLRPMGLSLKIFDAYRPQKASDFFSKWLYNNREEATKAIYYPNIKKSDLLRKNYIAKYSAHTRGSTVDVSIVYLSKAIAFQELDMGTPYDYFDTKSHTFSTNISYDILNRRLFLKSLMEEAGFKAIATEWWHFTLKKEPYPNTYFDFDIQ